MCCNDCNSKKCMKDLVAENQKDAVLVRSFLRDHVLAKTDEREITWDHLNLPYCARFLRQNTEKMFDFGMYRQRITDLWCANAEHILLAEAEEQEKQTQMQRLLLLAGATTMTKMKKKKTAVAAKAKKRTDDYAKDVFWVLEWLLDNVDCGENSTVEHPAFARMTLLCARSAQNGPAAANRVVKMVQRHLNKMRRKYTGDSSGSERAGENTRRRTTALRRLGTFMKNLAVASFCSGSGSGSSRRRPRQHAADATLLETLFAKWGTDLDILRRMVYPLYHMVSGGDCCDDGDGDDDERATVSHRLPVLCGIC